MVKLVTLDIGGNFYIDSENRTVNKYSNINVRGISNKEFNDLSEYLFKKVYFFSYIDAVGMRYLQHCHYDINGKTDIHENIPIKSILAVTKQHSDIIMCRLNMMHLVLKESWMKR